MGICIVCCNHVLGINLAYNEPVEGEFSYKGDMFARLDHTCLFDIF
jgi:hypothetical protein